MKIVKVLKENWTIILYLSLSIFSILPFFHSGFFSFHDDTQVVRVYEMAQALRDGQFPVRWVGDLGYGFGYPLFNFYAPLPYYVGAIFNLLGLDALWATKLMFLLGILLSGFFMYLLAREFWGKLGGILAALFYVYAPYHALDIYVRGAVGEFWAMAFLPLMALGFYKVFTISIENTVSVDKNLKLKSKIKNGLWKWMIVGSLGFAGVILSHNLTAMMTAPFLLLISLLFIYIAVKRKQLFIIHYSLFIILLGLGFSAFYWLPAIWEMRLTDVVSQIRGGADFRDHFVCFSQLWDSPWGFGGSTTGCLDGISFKVGKLHLILTFISFVSAVFFWQREKKKIFVILLAIFYLSFSIIMTTQYSKWVWEQFSPMAYIQYPWRFLTFTALITSFLAGAFLSFFKNQSVALTVFGILVFTLLFYQVKYFQPQRYLDLQAKDYISEENIKWRTSRISDEFLPKGFPKPTKLEGIIKEKITAFDKFSKISNPKIKSNRYLFQVEGENENLILVRVAYFPGWKVFVDGKEKLVLVKNGEIFFATPKGTHQVEVVFQDTPIRTVGNILSLISLSVMFGGALYVRKAKS